VKEQAGMITLGQTNNNNNNNNNNKYYYYYNTILIKDQFVNIVKSQESTKPNMN